MTCLTVTLRGVNYPLRYPYLASRVRGSFRLARSTHGSRLFPAPGRSMRRRPRWLLRKGIDPIQVWNASLCRSFGPEISSHLGAAGNRPRMSSTCGKAGSARRNNYSTAEAGVPARNTKSAERDCTIERLGDSTCPVPITPKCQKRAVEGGGWEDFGSVDAVRGIRARAADWAISPQLIHTDIVRSRSSSSHKSVRSHWPVAEMSFAGVAEFELD